MLLLRSDSVGHMVTVILAWILFAGTTALSANTTFEESGLPGCDALIAAGLGDRVVFATELEYEVRVQVYWNLNSRLRPWCFFLPHDTTEVSRGIVALLEGSKEFRNGAGEWHIAVRSAGHNMGNTNNVEYGVTIDLFYLNQTTYDPSTNLASVSPGSRWQDVYAILHEHGVLVAGGRDGSVGVGGYIIGGGSSYHQSSQGFGCDTVKNFEVVLVDGTVVNANEHHHSGLWRALKGGGSNFGIVTRFDMEALPDNPLAFRQRFMSAVVSAQFVDAVVDYIDNQQHIYRTDALVAIIAHIAGEELLTTTEVNTEGLLDSPGFARFAEIPQIAPYAQVVLPLFVLAPIGQLPSGQWDFINTISFRNNREMLNYAIEAHRRAAEELELEIGVGNFVSTLIFQPLPSYFADIAAQKGGNMFSDLVRDGNAVICTTELMIPTTEAQYKIGVRRFHQLFANLQRYAESIGADHPYLDLNYADASQDPLGSYPEKHIKHIRKMAKFYDPEQKFQTRIPGGFKISRVTKDDDDDDKDEL
ncbi:hypothetical protein BDV12DRAFT_210431 [Aspergillus spectabilis]